MRSDKTGIPMWLPSLTLFNDYHGKWDIYLNVLYSIYEQDFIKHRPVFRGKKLGVKRHPMFDGKEVTFWHIISEGEREDDRTPGLRRCERIRWPKPIVEHSNEPTIKVWENQRRGETRICIWLEKQDYLVVLAKRKTYILFWTSYPITYNHTRRKLQKEFESFKKAGAA